MFRQGHGSLCFTVGLSWFGRRFLSFLRLSLADGFNLSKIDIAFKHDVSFTLGSLKRPNVKVSTGLSFAVLNIVRLTAVEWVLN